MSVEIVLVDGVGRCALRTIPDLEPPASHAIARPYVTSGPDRVVLFVRTGDTAPEADGRPIYRQRGVYGPATRWAYLRLTPISG